jgi:hypothetical protein
MLDDEAATKTELPLFAPTLDDGKSSSKSINMAASWMVADSCRSSLSPAPTNPANQHSRQVDVATAKGIAIAILTQMCSTSAGSVGWFAAEALRQV